MKWLPNGLTSHNALWDAARAGLPTDHLDAIQQNIWILWWTKPLRETPALVVRSGRSVSLPFRLEIRSGPVKYLHFAVYAVTQLGFSYFEFIANL